MVSSASSIKSTTETDTIAVVLLGAQGSGKSMILGKMMLAEDPAKHNRVLEHLREF